MEKLWDVAKAADTLGLTEGGVRQMVFRKTIPYTKIGRCVRFDPEALSAWVRNRAHQVKELIGLQITTQYSDFVNQPTGMHISVPNRQSRQAR